MRWIGVALCAVASTAVVRSAEAQTPTSPADTGFAAMQSRGKAAMGVDQYTSTHIFEPLPDGGRIVLQRDSTDPAGTQAIRTHLRTIATAFAAGQFDIPGFVHGQTVPGTAVMAERRTLISYTVDTLPRGGEVIIQSGDSSAVAAVHEFLAFQRHAHHAMMHGDSTMHHP
jgi:hypothetical protein